MILHSFDTGNYLQYMFNGDKFDALWVYVPFSFTILSWYYAAENTSTKRFILTSI